jgi:succinoglycan biosynthesis transport protein ExoP
VTGIGGMMGGAGLNRFAQNLRTYRVLFLACFLLVLAAVIVATALRTPKYTAVTTVMIESRQRDISQSKNVLSELPAESGVIDSEVRVLQSREFAERLVQSLGLQRDTEFHKPKDDESPTLAFDRTVDKVMRAISVRRSGLTYVIDIAFQSRSPDKAAQIANDYAALYTNQQRGIKAQATQQASTLLEKRLNDMRGQLEQAEARVAEYRAAHGLMTSAGQNTNEQQLTDLDTRYAEARSAQEDADARLRSMENQLGSDPTGGSVEEALKSEVVRDLRAQRSAASAKVASLASRLGPRHPQLVAAQQELSDIDVALKQELRRILAGVRAQANIADSRAGSASAGVSAARGTLVADNAASVRLNELERNAQSVRGVYESYLARFQETSTQQGMETSDARVIAVASPPLKPSSPNWPISLMLGAIAGLASACSTVVVRQRMEQGVTSARDVEEIFDLPVIGTLPTLASAVDAPTSLAPYDYLVEKRRSLYSQAFMGLVSALNTVKVAEGGRVIALTSAVPDEGKSVTSLCLLRSMALAGESVVLIDSDLDRGGVSRMRRIDPEATLGLVLAGKATLDQALIEDEASGAWLLLAGRDDADRADLMTGGAMENILKELRLRFKTILLDTAPVLAIANARDLATMADAVLLLARWRHTSREDIFAALQILQRAGTNIAGIALTRVDLHKVKAYGYTSLRRYDGYHAG